MAPVLVLTGPTAVGKTALSLAWAATVGAEIVSVDSRQIYRGLDIGTAKPTRDERDAVTHHLIDERDLSDPIAAGAYARLAEERIQQLVDRGVPPVVVGGSMLYLDALIHGLADIPPVTAEVRDALVAEADDEAGRERLFQELSRDDPQAAATLDPTKSHRLIRLVGVLRAFGPPSEFWSRAPTPRFAYRVLALDRPRDDLNARIHQRIDAMLAEGLVDETQRHLEDGVRLDRGPLHTIGYAEPTAFLEGGISYERMVELLRRNTRRLAKRQRTWLRNRFDATWLDAGDAALLDTVKTTVG